MKFTSILISRLTLPLFFATLLINPLPLLAAGNELFFNMPIALSANRLEKPVSDAAVATSVIDRETIQASGARTIPDILRLIPGVQVGYSGNEFGDEPRYVVTYHGHSDQYSKQIQVLIDGRSIYDPFFGGILWKSIPINIDDIERIEVSRGPNLATYGSNSFLAAINIITRTAAEDQGTYVRTNVGNHDIADLTYRYGGNSGKLDYRVTGSTLNDNGLDSANRFSNPDNTHSHNIDYRMDYQYDNKKTLSYQGGYGLNYQQADRNHADVLPTARTVENTRFFQFIKFENVINKKNTILLQYYYNMYNKEDTYKSDPISFPGADPFRLNINASIKSERHNLELTDFIFPNKNLKLTWGLNAQVDFVRSPLFLGRSDKITHKLYRSFASAEWYINRSNIINAGGLIEHNDFTNTAFSPRLSFIHAFNNKHKIRLGISEGIRSPFIFEVMADTEYKHRLTIGGTPTGVTLRDQFFTGNRNLRNQKIISREIAYIGKLLKGTFLFNARVFHDNISNYIDIEKVTTNNPLKNYNTTNMFRNVKESATTGLELELNYHIDPTLRLIASTAIIKIRSNSGILAKSAPQHSFSLFITKQFNEKYNSSLAYYYVERFKWADAAHGSYQILNIRLSRNFNYNQTHGSLSLVLKNMLGSYSDYKSQPRTSTAPQIVQTPTAYIDLRINF